MRITLLSVLVSIIAFTSCEVKEKENDISASEFKAGIEKSNVQILDVRTEEEYSSGVIEGAINANWKDSEEFEKIVDGLLRDEPVYVYCHSGGRSRKAMDWLTENGFEEVYNLKGGITEWKENEFETTLPVAKEDAISSESFDQFVNSGKKVLVDVSTTWCVPCKKMIPVIEALEKEGVSVLLVDGDENDNLLDRLKVEAFPEFVVFQNGKELERFTGVTDIEELRAALK